MILHGANPNQVCPCHCGQWFETPTELARHIADAGKPEKSKKR